MSGFQKFWQDPDHINPTHMTHAQCKVGVSFDNKTFRVKRYRETAPNTFEEVKENYIVGAEEPQRIFANPVPFEQFWGTKIDVCGYTQYAPSTNMNWDVHPIWKNLEYDDQPDPPVRSIFTNTGNCILAKVYLPYTPSYMSEGLPKANNISGGIFITNIESTNDGFSWGDYAYFDFDETNLRPTSLTSRAALTIPAFGTLINEHPTAGTGKDFFPDISSLSEVPYGLYYGLYRTSVDGNPVGDFGTSNQRKMVMTGDIPHLVFESDGDVFYTINRGARAPVLNAEYLFAPMMKLSTSVPETGETITRKRPSIAVYQEGMTYSNTFEMTGKTAIAVTWAEYISKYEQPTTVKIYMRTREFDVCTYQWNTWSDPYEIHKHTYTADELNQYSEDEDFSTPVIAPLLKQIGTSQHTSLLGWTITWTSPQIDGNAAALSGKRHTGIYSRTWLRLGGGATTGTAVITDNSKWGTYYSASFLPSTPPTHGVKPPGVNGHNVIFEWQTPLDNEVRALDYPTVINSENKSYPNTLRNEFVCSTNGEEPGIFHKSITYKTSSTPYGNLETNPGGTSSVGTNITLDPGFQAGGAVSYYADRKPSVTVNSSGQTFIAWERWRRQWPIVIGQTQGIVRSGIIVRNTFLEGGWKQGNLSRPALVYEQDGNPFGPIAWNVLLDPSVTSYPKSKLVEKNEPSLDQDPGIVELLFWQNLEFTELSVGYKNRLQNLFIYSEGHGNMREDCNGIPADGKELPEQKGIGEWIATESPSVIRELDGVNSQRAFGVINAGPTFQNIPPLPSSCNDEKILNGFLNSSHAFGNDALGINVYLDRITLPVVGVYKGTYTEHRGVEEYRTIEFVKDTESVSFTWGEVYAGDTSTMQPFRQVALHFEEDSNWFSNLTQYSDGFYQTKVFDWQPGKEIRYWRGMFATDSTSFSTGGVFHTSSVLLKYTVELVSDSSVVLDTLETMEFAPYYNKLISGERKRFVNGNLDVRNVRLRVRLSAKTGIDDDSTAQVYTLFRKTEFPSISDSVIVVYKGAYTDKPMVSGALYASAVFPNPASIETGVSVIVSYPKGYPVTLTLFDILGREASRQTIESAGVQQLVTLPRISAGSYFLHIAAGGYQITQPVMIEER